LSCVVLFGAHFGTGDQNGAYSGLVWPYELSDIEQPTWQEDTTRA
jgi:hypothetical protein